MMLLCVRRDLSLTLILNTLLSTLVFRVLTLDPQVAGSMPAPVVKQGKR